jgi:hypothetical protein
VSSITGKPGKLILETTKRVLGENPIDSEKRERKRKRHRGISMLDISLHGIYTMTPPVLKKN